MPMSMSMPKMLKKILYSIFQNFLEADVEKIDAEVVFVGQAQTQVNVANVNVQADSQSNYDNGTKADVIDTNEVAEDEVVEIKANLRDCS